MNDRVAPFLGGAAFIALRAQKKLGPSKPIFGIPVSMKFSHTDDCTDEMMQHVRSLEEQLDLPHDDQLSIRQRLRRVGLQILSRNLRQRGFIPPESDHSAEGESLNQVLADCAIQIISHLEQKMELGGDENEAPIERVRRVRAAIHQIRIDETQQLDHRVATTWADEAILALRILGYCGEYVKSSPTLDRHLEAVEKLREDLAEKILLPVGDRKAIVQFGHPINIADSLELKSRQAAMDLTSQFESAVQQGLDEINSTNECIGAKMLE